MIIYSRESSVANKQCNSHYQNMKVFVFYTFSVKFVTKGFTQTFRKGRFLIHRVLVLIEVLEVNVWGLFSCKSHLHEPVGWIFHNCHLLMFPGRSGH